MIKNNERKRAYKRIEWMFYHWRKLDVAITEARYDVPKEELVGGKGSFISDPTGQAAIKNISPLACVVVDGDKIFRPEAWLNLIEHVYGQCSDVDKAVFKKRYIERVSPTRTAIDLYMAETTYFDIVNSIKSYAVELALQEGLVRVYAGETA